MLASLRKSARSWAAGLILLIALIAIVITGFGTDGMGGLGAMGGAGTSGDTLAKAGDRRVTEPELSTFLTQQYNRAREQQPTLDMRTFLASGAYEQILNQLVLAASIDAFGEDQGVIVSPRMIDREIVNIPAFRNFAGQFDENVFRQQLQRQRLTERQVRDDIARQLMQRQVLGPVALGARVPEGVARQYANLLLERRRGSIGVVPAEALAAGINPNAAQISAYFNRNRARFMIPERRVIKYAMIGPEQLGAAGQASEQEVAAFYRQNQAAYGPGETRDIQQIVLPDRAAAQAFAARVNGGTPFAEAASAAGFSAGDISLNAQTRAAYAGATSPAVANAVFAAQQGALVGPIQGTFGFYVARTERINRTPARPLEAVRAEIAQQLSQRKTADALAALVARVEDRLNDGASVEEIARAERLQVVTTPPITATGQVPGQTWVVPPELQPLLSAAFEIDPENPDPIVEQIQQSQRFALIGLDRTIAAAPPPIAQIQDQLRTALIREVALTRARAVAQQIVDRINGGMPPAQAFAQAQPRLEAPRAVNLQRLEISRGGQQVPPPLITLFSLAQGRAQILPAPNGQGWFIVHHEQRTPGAAAGQPQLIATTRTEFTQSAAEELAQQFARSIEGRVGVQRNAEAIQRSRARLAGDYTE
jgi:peptidyl-prolyl cis-trans isomerase D